MYAGESYTAPCFNWESAADSDHLTHRTQIGEFGRESAALRKQWRVDPMFDSSRNEDEIENALLSAVQQTRGDYETATREDLLNRRTAYTEALRAFNAYLIRT